MNAEEFRLYNFYMPTDGSKEPATVTMDDLKAWSLGAVYGKPMLLTDKWLINAGFESFNEGYYIPVNDISTTLNLEYVGGYWYPSIEQTPEFSSQSVQVVTLNCIEYVHQLQNLFYTLSGLELDI